ncbi:hypothetical protein [Phyllobacterium zundukense]|uniref:Uncharacterized protein n=1 Tax=Phyllobacterium zundukense TaxID=1867719 RepID=A0ACD4CYR5_9HYPH|nr:hypothetical protein [Phyllobacterium zundukense]UXN58776.1 hypothetical protein N8E88_07560 [Phyllobacterium zundukense]
MIYSVIASSVDVSVPSIEAHWNANTCLAAHRVIGGNESSAAPASALALLAGSTAGE